MNQLNVWLLLLFLASLLILPINGVAQDHPKGELFVGFSGRSGGDPILRGWNVSAAAHVNKQLEIVGDFSGHYGTRNTAQTGVGSFTFTNLTGFLMGIPSSPGSASTNNSMGTDVYSFMAGPQFSQHLTGRARIFVRALFGASHVHVQAPNFIYVGSGSLGFVPNVPSNAVVNPILVPYLNLYPLPNSGVLPSGISVPENTKTGFSFGVGGGLDVSINKNWAVRVLQADYINKPNVLGQG